MQFRVGAMGRRWFCYAFCKQIGLGFAFCSDRDGREFIEFERNELRPADLISTREDGTRLAEEPRSLSG